MAILDRYVLQSFTKILVICFLSLTGLYVVIDVFNNLEEFIAYGQQLGSFIAVVCDYYAARVLSFFDRTSALIVTTAALFTVNGLQRTQEFTALTAAGIPPVRIIKPIVVSAVIMSVLAAANRELLLPQFRHKLTRNAQDWLGTSARQLRPRYDNQTDVWLGGRYTVWADRRIDLPHFRLPPSLRGFGAQLVAKRAYYRPATAERPSGYLLEGVEQPGDLARLPTARMNGRAIVLSPRDTPWLAANQCFLVSDVDFEQLAGGTAWCQYASSLQLIHGLRNSSLDYGADVKVTIHARLIQPLLDLVLLLLCLPMIITRHDRNIFVAAGMCLLIVATFFVVVLACHALGANGYLVSPSLAVWCPLLIFGPLAYTASAVFGRSSAH